MKEILNISLRKIIKLKSKAFFIVVILLLIIIIFISVNITNRLQIELRQKNNYSEGEIVATYDVKSKYLEEAYIVINIENDNGIKEIYYPDGKIINANNKKKVAIDYNVTRGNTYKFKIKSDTQEKDFIINADDIYTSNSLTITYANSCYYIDTYTYNTNLDTTEMVNQYLFDGITDNGGAYKGVLVLPQRNSYILMKVTGTVTIYAYGHYYSDTAGGSGKNAIFEKKQSNGTYAFYKSVPTRTDGMRYKLIDLEEGEYKLTPSTYYVGFDEWEII